MCFALEPPEAIAISGEDRWQDLDRYIAAEARVVRAIHFAHSPRAEAPIDAIGAKHRAGGKTWRRGIRVGQSALRVPASCRFNARASTTADRQQRVVVL